MPTVPLYDGPQLQSAPLRGGESAVRATPDAFGEIQAKQSAQLGQGLAVASQALQNIQFGNDKALADTADTAMRKGWTEFDMAARQKYQGTNIGEYEAAAKKWWADAPATYGKDLTPQAKAIASKSMGNAQTQAMTSALTHTATVTDNNQQVAFHDRNAKIIDDAAAAGTPGAISVARTNIIASVVERAAIKGWDDATREQEVTKWNTILTSGYVMKLSESSPSNARKYLEEAKAVGFLSAKVYNELAPRIEERAEVSDGQIAAREDIAKLTKGLGAFAAFPRSLVDAEGVARFANKDKALAAFRQELDRADHLHLEAGKDMSSAATKQSWDDYSKRVPLATMMTRPYWKQMEPEQRVRMEEHVKQQDHLRYARNDADKARAERQLQLKYAPLMVVMSQPEVLKVQTPTSITAMIPDIGAANVDKLLHTLNQYNTNQVKFSQAKLDTDSFNKALYDAGKNPKPSPKDLEANRAINTTREAVESAVGALQKSKNRELTNDEKDVEIRRVVNSKVMEKGWFGRHNEVNVIDLSPGELSKAGILVDTVGTAVTSGKQVVTQKLYTLADVDAQPSVAKTKFASMLNKLKDAGLDYDTSSVLRAQYDYQKAQTGKK